MSWHFSRALVEEYSEAACSDGERSALSSSTHTHETFCWHAKTMDALSRSRSGMTCGRLMDAHGEALLTSFREDSRVRTSAQPVKAQELQARSQDCGQKWRASFATFDPDTHSLRTVQCSLLEDSTAYSAILPRWGSMLNGELSERTMPAHLTSVTGSGSWLATPTATANQLSPSMMKHPGCQAWLPTPSASSYGTNQGGGMGRKGKVRPSLQTMARKNLWPTPNSRDWKGPPGAGTIARGGRQSSLPAAVARNLWPTPTAHNAKETNAPSKATRNTPTLAAQVGGKLNPTWVEWLMGWPLGWTDCGASATDKFQAWLRSHGAR